MPREFKSAEPLMRELRKDLTERTFPHLLTHLATGVKVQLVAGLADAAKKAGGKSPPVKMSVFKIPPPGTSEVKSVFLASSSPVGDQKSLQEAEAYKEAFRLFYKEKLGSKALVLRLLASVGVS